MWLFEKHAVFLKMKPSGAGSKHWILNESDTEINKNESTEETNEVGCKEAEI